MNFLLKIFGSKTDSLARRLVNARLRGESYKVYPGTMPQSLDEAYQIQSLGIQLFPDNIAGWKVGGIGGSWRDELGQSRLVGPVFQSFDFKDDGNRRDMPIFENGFAAIEGEVTAIIAADADPAKTEYTTEEALKLIRSMHVGIEVASSPFPEINDHGPLVTITDFGNNYGLILGDEIPNWRKLELSKWHFKTIINGDIVGEGTPTAAPGGPVESVRYLLENTAKRGLPLKAGMKVLTGAVTGVHQAYAGDDAEVVCNDLPPLRCRLVPFSGDNA